MKRHHISASILIGAICTASLASASDFASESRQQRGLMRMQRGFAPRQAPSRMAAVPLTRASVATEVDQRTASLFDRAADPATHLVTQESASKSGLGFFVDHFAEIDRDRDGSLKFSEVKGFLDARSPVAKPASGSVQIIE
ncbi:hypothetical protein [Phyllobacterium sp. UNC302MFCol5.2]|uniref:hypothetical protein n=1 Tax=Phyllobacterium sp. UNC302MFCol5.2 TaxID=1449065 RepID=UPI000482365C|nr:hypothetical protein [Phyllobacterium sp. UNC302MFCol5.2]